jgi:hypothetical protein
MESKTSSGQILIECALGLLVLALLLTELLQFNGKQSGHRFRSRFQSSNIEKIQKNQVLDFTKYRNER